MNTNFSIDVNVRISLDGRMADLIEGLAAKITGRDATEQPDNAVRVPEPQPHPEPEPEQIRIITDEEMRQEVKTAKDKAGVEPVRAVFGEYGVRSSVNVPQERRREFVDKLRSL